MLEQSRGYRRGTGGYTRITAALFAAGMATFISMYSAQAVLPQLAREFDVSPATSALAVSATTGVLAFAIVPASILSERFGRIRVMAASALVSALIGLLIPLAHDLGVVLAGRALQGLTLAGVPAVAMAYLAEEVDGRDLGPTTFEPTSENARFAVGLMRELTGILPSDRVNIGCDEPWELGRGRSRDACEREGLGVVYARYVAEVAQAFLDDGKRVEVWAEVFGKLQPRPYSICSSPLTDPHLIALTVSVVRWDSLKGHPRGGVCSTHLADAEPGATVPVPQPPAPPRKRGGRAAAKKDAKEVQAPANDA